MTVPSSGELALRGNLGIETNVTGSNVSLGNISRCVGIATPDKMTDLYGLEMPTSSLCVCYLVIAGGGGKSGLYAGGGGAGGYRNSYPGYCSGANTSPETPNNIAAAGIVTSSAYTVTVGAGGSGGQGSNSVWSTITSIGGGLGPGEVQFGCPGGSGGGGNGAGSRTGGAGCSGQGSSGGRGCNPGPNQAGGGGGGGARCSGCDAQGTCYAGNGGDGYCNPITGTNVARGGGGGGTWQATSNRNGSGGLGGGGSCSAGSVNTGGGSGGGTGGSGIVILRYKKNWTIISGSGLTSTTTVVGDDKVTQFTAGTDSISFGNNIA